MASDVTMVDLLSDKVSPCDCRINKYREHREGQSNNWEETRAQHKTQGNGSAWRANRIPCDTSTAFGSCWFIHDDAFA